MKKINLLLFFILITSLIGSCGKTNADNTHAEVIQAPLSGYTCFSIKDNDGKTVGGSCVKS